jgi:hypothetical protein
MRFFINNLTKAHPPDYSFGSGSGAISLVLATTGISSLRTGSVANGTEVVFHKLPASSYK